MRWYEFEVCLGDGTRIRDRLPAKSPEEAERTVMRIHPGARWAELRGTEFENVANRPRVHGRLDPETGGPRPAPPPAPPPSRPPARPWWEVLEVDPRADDAAIRAAYRERVKEYHPDRVSGAGLGRDLIRFAEERTREINAAWAAARAGRG